ncbi:MAG: hypothetical protein M3Y58_11075 [Chloroflexota bacterium]|nr:hypothetical protein [Chloroflexota bacterium]
MGFSEITPIEHHPNRSLVAQLRHATLPQPRQEMVGIERERMSVRLTVDHATNPLFRVRRGGEHRGKRHSGCNTRIHWR